MIPYGHQSINQNDINEVVKVLKSDWLTQGPKILEFEKSLAKYCRAKYAVAVANGTSALHLSYLVAGFKKGDKVITTPNTFVATTNMLLVLGVKPVFCDIRLDICNIDERKIERLITKQTRAIIPVHFAGHPCEMEKIWRLAKKYKLKVIEDASHALGAKYKGSQIGSCKYSDMAVFSFHPVKPITTGEGGAILTNNKKYYEKIISLRNHGIHKDTAGKNVMTELGYNYRMNDMEASLGISQLKRLDGFIKKKHQVIKWYESELKNIKEIILPKELKSCYSGWHIYVIRVLNPELRDDLARYLKKNRISVSFHYPVVYFHPYYKKIGYKNTRLKNEEIYQKSCITLPCYTGLTRKEIEFISNKIRRFYKKIK